MARLDTQINQIYYVPPEASQVSLVLTDELINNNAHLFLIADLAKIQKKTEGSDLKKISEIILEIFRDNKKLGSESLFENSLSAINQELADLAHGGKKAWLGKFSALIGLKAGDNIFLANSGQMRACIYRDGEFLDILNPEKRGLHPLKTFSNFTSGKLKASDVLLLSTSNLLNYVALEHLTNLMDEGVSEATEKVSKIIKDTASNTEAFGSLFVSFTKPQQTSPASPTPAPVAAPIPESIPEGKPVVETPEAIEEPSTPIYAPLPSKSKTLPNFTAVNPAKILTKLPKPNLRAPKMPFRIPKLGFWEHLSPWAKFFLISFLIFLLLFGANIIAYTIRKRHRLEVDQKQEVINQLTKDLNDAESALIYRNQDQALKLLSAVQQDMSALKSLDMEAYNQYQARVSDISNRINHITVVDNPEVVATLKHAATDLARAGNGFVISDQQTGTVTTYNTASDDKDGRDLFLLNNIGEIRGLVHVPGTGHVVITSSEMYLVNTTQSQFDLLHVYPKTDLSKLELLSPDRLYTIDRDSGQVLRIQFSKQTQITPVPLLKSSLDMENIIDLGVDTDVWLLSSTGLSRYKLGSKEGFELTQPTDEITSANRLFVGNNLYILESAKKRLLIYNKQGALLTQVFFPNSTDMTDLYVDETSRNIYILDSNKLERITF